MAECLDVVTFVRPEGLTAASLATAGPPQGR